MTGRERLEDIKNFVKTINGDFTAQLFGYDIKPESIVNDFKWLIKQAERVQELEETNKKNYWIAADFKFENLKLEQQNKRYRKVLEEIYELAEYDEYDNTLEQIVSEVEKALEGEG